MSDHTVAMPAYQPEPDPAPSRRSRRGLVAVVASVVAVVLVAGGGFAAWQFFLGGGPRPAEVLPASTFALVTVDLNPSGGQKIKAIQTLRKFPSFKKRTGLTPDSDVMKAIFDKALEKGPCKSLDYERDVKPWIGDRAGVGGVVLGDGKPAPVFALQITDRDRATTGFARLMKCADPADDEFGFTTTDDYVIASDSDAHAVAIADDGKKSSLAEDADFQRWTDEAGGPGIVNAYLGRKSFKILTDGLGPELGGLGGGLGGGLAGGLGGGTADGPGDQLSEAFKDFKGAAAGLRFADGGIELAFAGGGAGSGGDASVGKHVGALPKDTAAVVALAVPDKVREQLESAGASGSLSLLGNLFAGNTGLDLPDDLITLLGDSLSVSLGGDAPADLRQLSGPGDLPLGALVHGDDTKIRAIIEKVEANTGAQLSELPATVASKDGKVAIATTPGYADDLLGDGSLADSKNFKDVVSHADVAQSVIYLSLDNKWMDGIRGLASDGDDQDVQEVADNLAVLRALGGSAWRDGDTTHGLIRIALK